MSWNAGAYEVLGGADAESPAGQSDLVNDPDRMSGGPLPAAVREWFLLGGARRLAAISANTITQNDDLAAATVNRFLASGYLLLETDSQRCCRRVGMS